MIRSNVPRWLVVRSVSLQLLLLCFAFGAFFVLEKNQFSIAVIFTLFATLSAIFSARSLRPLGRLLLAAQEAQSQELLSLTELRKFRLETASWRDLERVIEQMRETLRSRNESLNREREELRVLMSSISDSIVAVDRVGIPLFFNTRFSLLVQNPESLKSRETRIDAYFLDPLLGRSFQNVLSSGEETTIAALNLPLRGELGSRFFTVSISALRDPQGNVYGAVGIFHDVTELKVAEQMRIDFVANVSHELRTPLTSIKGYADTLIADLRKGQAPEIRFLETIERNVDRLMSLISDLLDLSWLESGEVLNIEGVDLRVLTEKVLMQLKEKIENKRTQILCTYEANEFQGDSARLEQVLTNLIENAIKYTPEQSQISVVWREQEDFVNLFIRDNGPGISQEHLPRLFERFYRVDKGRSRDQGGTGLGLAIVKHIVQRHGGTVSVQSELKKGTEFQCRFPKNQ